MIGGPFTPLIEYLESIHTMDTECIDSVYTTKQQEQEQEQAEPQAYAQAYAQVKTEEEEQTEFDKVFADFGYISK
jgi:hypothetical protein